VKKLGRRNKVGAVRVVGITAVVVKYIRINVLDKLDVAAIAFVFANDVATELFFGAKAIFANLNLKNT
jgi:hypothetical protein